MPKKKASEEQVFITEPKDTGIVQIHVKGDMLPNTIFLRILDYMKAYRDSKEIVFVVDDPKMMLLIRNSFPSQYYERIEIYSPVALEQEGELRNAG